MSENKKPCPEFPYWGASYPDACCVNGKLQDLDYCDENGNLYDKGEDVPCPFCRTEEFIEYDPTCSQALIQGHIWFIWR